MPFTPTADEDVLVCGGWVGCCAVWVRFMCVARRALLLELSLLLVLLLSSRLAPFFSSSLLAVEAKAEARD